MGVNEREQCVCCSPRASLRVDQQQHRKYGQPPDWVAIHEKTKKDDSEQRTATAESSHHPHLFFFCRFSSHPLRLMHAVNYTLSANPGFLLPLPFSPSYANPRLEISCVAFWDLESLSVNLIFCFFTVSFPTFFGVVRFVLPVYCASFCLTKHM